MKKFVTSQKYLKMCDFNEENEGMPEGAFYALAEDIYGWDVEDWAWFCEVLQRDPRPSNKNSVWK